VVKRQSSWHRSENSPDCRIVNRFRQIAFVCLDQRLDPDIGSADALGLERKRGCATEKEACTSASRFVNRTTSEKWLGHRRKGPPPGFRCVGKPSVDHRLFSRPNRSEMHSALVFGSRIGRIRIRPCLSRNRAPIHFRDRRIVLRANNHDRLQVAELRQRRKDLAPGT